MYVNSTFIRFNTFFVERVGIGGAYHGHWGWERGLRKGIVGTLIDDWIEHCTLLLSPFFQL